MPAPSASLDTHGRSARAPSPAEANEIPNPDHLGFWAEQTLQPRKVAEFLDLDRQTLAKFSGVALRGVRFDARIPQPVLEWLTEIAHICDLVAEFFRGDAVKTRLWFQTRNPMLGDLSPRDLIRIGLHRKLHRFIVEALKENEGPPDPRRRQARRTRK